MLAKTTLFFFACGGQKTDKNSFSPGSIVKTLIKKFRLRRANKKTKNKHDPLKNRGENLNISKENNWKLYKIIYNYIKNGRFAVFI